MDDLTVFGALIDVCGARHALWPDVTCNLLAGHDELFHSFERYDAAGDVVEWFSWRVES
jgi:hypothetical protein